MASYVSKIIAHRGFWITESEKNTEVTFQRTFELKVIGRYL